MPAKFSYLFQGYFNIRGKNIYCKVTGEPGTANDGNPYIILITGGPGFGHRSTEDYVRPLIDLAKKNGQHMPHFILLDNLGCGLSDRATDKNKEYTVDHFTDISGDVVKAVKNHFNLPKMDLYVEGGSFGSLVAINFPARHPAWLDPNSDIKLKQLTVRVMPNGEGERNYSLDYLRKHCSERHDYLQIVRAQKKLLAGDLQNKTDYVQNFVIPMAGLYSKNADKSIFFKIIKSLVNKYPNFVFNSISAANKVLSGIGIENEQLNLANEIINGCSVEVLNHFFKEDFSGFNTTKTVLNNLELYKKLPLLMISGKHDHEVPYRVSENLNNVLGKGSAFVLFDAPHMISKGENKFIYTQIMYDNFITGFISKKDVDYPVIIKETINEQFNAKLKAAHQKSSGSTAPLLKNMPINSSEPQTLTETKVSIKPSDTSLTKKVDQPAAEPVRQMRYG